MLAEAGALTAEALAFAAMSQRLLLRQIARPLQPGAEASVLKVISAANVASLRRAVLDWHGAGAAVLSGPARDYLCVPPQLIGGGTAGNPAERHRRAGPRPAAPTALELESRYS